MIRSLVAFLFALALMVSGSAFAGNNAAPFNLEIGVATLEQVQKEIGAGEIVTGLNKFTKGPMYRVHNPDLGIDGLKEVTFIFDSSDVLMGVLLTLPKNPKSMVKTLSGKYKLLTNRVNDFMNYGYAKFQKGDTYIEVDSPHVSFDMEVRYIDKTLMAKFNDMTSKEEAEKQKRKENAL